MGTEKDIQEKNETLEKIIEEKNKKIVQLAESVATTQPPTPRKSIFEKYKIKYQNKYTEKQLLSFKKLEIDTTLMGKEELPNVDHIKTN